MPEPVMGSLALRLAAVLVLVAANAFFVAAEFALVAARRTRIEELIRRGDRKAKTVQQALQDLYRQLSAAQLGITVASILLGYVAEDTVAHLFREWFAGLPPALDFLTRGGIASVVAVAIISFLHVVCGDQAPKAWAITSPERTSRWIARPLILFSWITRPFTDTLNWSANRVVRLLGIRGTTAELERIHSPEEIRMLVAQSRRRGGLDAGDARMLEGVFEFSEKTAREVMTPRTDMVALPLDLTLEEAADQVAVAGRSRDPVYRESLDDIVGLVHAKDILAGVPSAKGGRLQAVLRPARFGPGTPERWAASPRWATRSRFRAPCSRSWRWTGAGWAPCGWPPRRRREAPLHDRADPPRRARPRGGSGAPAADAAACRAGATRRGGLRGDHPAHLRVRGGVRPRGRRRRPRRPADPLLRPRRQAARAPLRLHGERGPAGGDEARRPSHAPPPLLQRRGVPPRPRAGEQRRPAPRNFAGRCRAVGRRHQRRRRRGAPPRARAGPARVPAGIPGQPRARRRAGARARRLAARAADPRATAHRPQGRRWPCHRGARVAHGAAVHHRPTGGARPRAARRARRPRGD